MKILRKRFEGFVVDMKDFTERKHYKLLREELNPEFKDIKDEKIIIQHLENQELESDQYFYLAKFKIQAHLKKVEKYFPGCHAALWLYCQNEDDVYMLSSPSMRKQLSVDYGIQFNGAMRYHVAYQSVITNQVIYADLHKPATYFLKDAFELWSSYGYDSFWSFPFHVEGNPVASLGLSFNYDVGRLPSSIELDFINNELQQLEEEFKTILLDYEEHKCFDTKKIL